jgi:hypothetical protein
MLHRYLPLGLLLPLLACTSVPQPEEQRAGVVGSNAWTLSPVQPGPTRVAVPQWQHYRFPGKPATAFSYTDRDGRNAMEAHADSSASMLRQLVHIAPAELSRIQFSWKVPELIAQADLARRDGDDSPVRVVLAFDGDRSRFSTKNALLSELSHAITGEPLPYATLMYVWCNTRKPGSVVINPRTDRIRELVVESGVRNLDQWMDYERDIRADFVHAFGEQPGALVGIGIMTDSDNTQSSARAWYGPLRLTAAR